MKQYAITGNGNDVHMLNVVLKKLRNHIKLLNFWWILAI